MTAKLARAASETSNLDCFVGIFEHSQLRLAAGNADHRRRHRNFLRDLRKLVDPIARAHLNPSEQERLALSLISEVKSFGEGAESARAFKIELLRTMRESCATPRLLYELFLANLKRAGVEVKPAFWMYPLAAAEEIERPRLELRSSPGVKDPADSIPPDCADAAMRAVRLAADAVAQGKLDTWSVDDCRLTICMLAISAIHRTPGQIKSKTDPMDRLSFFEGEGMAVWKALGEHAHPLHPKLHEVYWGDSMRGQILLHLRGSVHSAQIGASAGSMGQPASSPALAAPGLTLVLREPIPAASDLVDKNTLGRYECLLTPLPVAPMPNPQELTKALAEMEQEFPWATQAIAHLCRHLTTASLLGVQELVLPPTLLVGPPGSGKSRFVRRLAERLALPYMPISLGGASDSKLVAGSARGWGGADASPIIRVLAQKRSASALILLDEIDKIAERYEGGSIDAQLLGLLEPETASRWRDSYLLAACDLSKVSYWATANGLANIKRPLLSRMEPLLIPAPRREHMPAIAAGLVRDAEREWSLPTGTLPDPPAELCDAGAENIRVLRRLVHRFLADWTREHRSPARLH